MQSSLKKIGNSFGVILNKKLLSQAGISNDSHIIIETKNNSIVISSSENRRPINRDLTTWRKQMKTAIKQGEKPEKNIWGNRLSKKEEKDWTW